MWLSRTLWIQVCTQLQSFLFQFQQQRPLFSDCKSRYIFGDVHLGMSCRLKNTSTNLLQQYLWRSLKYVALLLFHFPSLMKTAPDILLTSCRCCELNNIVVARMGMIFDFPFWLADEISQQGRYRINWRPVKTGQLLLLPPFWYT